MSEEAEASVSLYVLIRVADADPNAGSAGLRARRVKTICDNCQAPCWLDPLGLRDVDSQIPRVCLQCADELLAQKAQVPQ